MGGPGCNSLGCLQAFRIVHNYDMLLQDCMPRGGADLLLHSMGPAFMAYIGWMQQVDETSEVIGWAAVCLLHRDCLTSALREFYKVRYAHVPHSLPSGMGKEEYVCACGFNNTNWALWWHGYA